MPACQYLMLLLIISAVYYQSSWGRHCRSFRLYFNSDTNNAVYIVVYKVVFRCTRWIRIYIYIYIYVEITGNNCHWYRHWGHFYVSLTGSFVISIVSVYHCGIQNDTSRKLNYHKFGHLWNIWHCRWFGPSTFVSTFRNVYCSIANALGLLQSCTKPSKYIFAK